MTNWTIEERRQIWNKGQVVPGYDPTMWRKDRKHPTPILAV